MKTEFRQLRLSQLDRNVELARSLPPRPSGGWIASVRDALGLSQRQVGKKMRASGQAIQQFEKAEAEDRITLRAIRRVAGTMGCDLVYVLVPKSGSFAELAEQPTRDWVVDRKSTRLNSSHLVISYAVFCLKKKKQTVPQSMFMMPKQSHASL